MITLERIAEIRARNQGVGRCCEARDRGAQCARIPGHDGPHDHDSIDGRLADLADAVDDRRDLLTALDQARRERDELRVMFGGIGKRDARVFTNGARASHPNCPARSGTSPCKCAELYAADNVAKVSS